MEAPGTSHAALGTNNKTATKTATKTAVDQGGTLLEPSQAWAALEGCRHLVRSPSHQGHFGGRGY